MNPQLADTDKLRIGKYLENVVPNNMSKDIPQIRFLNLNNCPKHSDGNSHQEIDGVL